MDYNLPEMQENIRANFETMLQFVTSDEAQTATANQIERNLFQLLLSLGAQLLLPSSKCVPKPVHETRLLWETKQSHITANKNGFTFLSSAKFRYGDPISMHQQLVDILH